MGWDYVKRAQLINCKTRETMFIMSPPQYMYLSSSIVKEIASLHGDLGDFVPPCVRKALEAKFA